MATMELARVDASCATFYLVHTFLAMLTVSLMVSVRQVDLKKCEMMKCRGMCENE